MDFFDKLGKKASVAYKVTADKTGKLAKEAKLKMKISDLRGDIDDIYKDIGKKVYENHVREEKENLTNELDELCTKIDVLSEEIETNLQECLKLKDRRKCSSCFKEIDKDAKYCPECGTEQEKIEEPEETSEDEESEAKEVEIVDNTEIKEETSTDDE